MKKDGKRGFRGYTPLAYGKNYGVYLMCKIKENGKKPYLVTTGISSEMWRIANKKEVVDSWLAEQRIKRAIGVLKGENV